jgi:hypothetical protein
MHFTVTHVLLRLLAAEACRDVPVTPLAEHAVNLAGVSAEKCQVEWRAKQKRTSRCTYDRLGGKHKLLAALAHRARGVSDAG